MVLDFAHVLLSADVVRALGVHVGECPVDTSFGLSPGCSFYSHCCGARGVFSGDLGRCNLVAEFPVSRMYGNGLRQKEKIRNSLSEEASREFSAASLQFPYEGLVSQSVTEPYLNLP